MVIEIIVMSLFRKNLKINECFEYFITKSTFIPNQQNTIIAQTLTVSV